MGPRMQRHRSIAAAAALLAAAPGIAGAQDAYPSRQIRVLVGFAPGGPTDVIARLLSARMATTLGQPLVIENRVGANGNIAAETTAKTSPIACRFLNGLLPAGWR